MKGNLKAILPKSINKLFLFIMIIICLKGAMLTLGAARTTFNELRASRFDYVRLQKTYVDVANALAARKILPENATVRIIPYYTDIRSVSLRYYVYPVKASSVEGDYIIDLDQAPNFTDKEWHIRKFGNGARLITKSKYLPIRTGYLEKSLPALPILIYVLGYCAVAGFAGTVILSLLNMSGRLNIFLLGTSFLLGNLLMTTLAWLFLLMGGSLERGALLALWILGIGLFLLLLKMKRRSGDDINNDEVQVPQYVNDCRHKACLFINGLLILVVSAVVVVTIAQPVIFWDAMSNWLIKAKVIFLNHHLQFDYTHLNWYPIFWPLNIACLFIIWGDMVDPVALWLCGIFFIAFVIQLLQGLRRVGIEGAVGSSAVLVYILLIYIAPYARTDNSYFVRADANNVLLAYMTGVIAYILSWLKSERKNNGLIVALVLAVGLSLSKLEGVFITFFIVSALIWALRKASLNRKDKLTIASFIIVMLMPLAWIAWVKAHGYGEGVIHFQSGLSIEKFLTIARAINKYVITNSWVWVSAWLWVYLVFKGPVHKKDVSEIFLFYTFVLIAIFSIAAMLGTPAGGIMETCRIDFPRLYLYATVPLCLYFLSRMFPRENG